MEMFGAFGLWHTKDYALDVESIDFFEIDQRYIKYATKSFRNKNIKFYCTDSIEYIKKTNKRYDMVIADIPYDLKVYDEDTGLPDFLNSMFEVAGNKAILIFNLHTEFLKKFKKVTEEIQLLSGRKIADIFFVSRNLKVAYVIVVLDE